MKCYLGGTVEDGEDDRSALCFASNLKEAENLLWEFGGGIQEDCDYDQDNFKVMRKPNYDHLYDSSKKVAYLVNDNTTLRQMGYLIEGDEYCRRCELYTMDNEFSLCGDCEQCEQCGHDEYCSNIPPREIEYE